MLYYSLMSQNLHRQAPRLLVLGIPRLAGVALPPLCIVIYYYLQVYIYESAH